MMPIPQNFDVIVIGGGQGAALARMLCEGGKTVALVEKEALGGSCVNRGCTPTKAHLAAAKRAHDARTAPTVGVYAQEVHLDLPAVVARSRKIVASFEAEVRGKLESLPTLEIVFGTARFCGTNTLEVTSNQATSAQKTRVLTAPNLVIATGTRAEIPAIEGLNKIPYLDHRSLLQLETLPEKLLVLGGGYIGCEFAQMFQRFGSQVVIAQGGPRLLEREDPDIAGALAAILQEENLEILFDCKAQAVEKTPRGLKCRFEGGQEIEASHLLIATGQTPNTRDLGLENTEVKLNRRGEIETDEFLSAAKGIWALGDVKGGPAFTHIAYDDARILGDILLHGRQRSIRGRAVPYCVFTDPQLGRIGLSEREAREKGLEIRVASLPCTQTARGIESGEAGGFLKAVVEAQSGQILGGAFLCRDGGEMIAVLQMAMAAKMPYGALRDGIFAHPTFAESLNNLFVTMEREERGVAARHCLNC